MMRSMTDREKLTQAADLLRLQSAKICELRAEVTRLNRVIENSCDALTILQRIYSNPRSPPSVTLKAAGFERQKPPAVSTNVTAPLYDMLEARERPEQAKPDVTPKPGPAA
jgi:hypothetical protein